METDVTGSTQDLQVGGYVLSRQTRMIKVRPCLKGEGGTVVGAWGGGGYKNFAFCYSFFLQQREDYKKGDIWMQLHINGR